jgi:large subunit ribosomal protein LP2
MKYIAAYLLANLSGEVSADKINSILSAVGVEVDSSRVEALLSQLEGKDLAEIIAEGNSKLASVPSGGAVAASSGAPAAGGAAAAAPVEEEKEAAKEESDEDMVNCHSLTLSRALVSLINCFTSIAICNNTQIVPL